MLWNGLRMPFRRSTRTGVRYVRMTTLGIYSGGTRPGYYDIRYHDENGSTQYPASNMTSNVLPSPYVASAITEFAAGYEAFRAFDGTTTNWWTTPNSTVSNWWISLDLGSSKKLMGITFNTRVTTGALKAPTGIVVHGSDTGSFAGEEIELYRNASLANVSDMTIRYFNF